MPIPQDSPATDPATQMLTRYELDEDDSGELTKTPILITDGVAHKRAALRTDGLPEDVDILVGHGRFSGAAALYLRDQRYPNARVVHVVHAFTDEDDRWRGDPEQATRHARTERTLISRADLVVAVGPLLADDAARMAQMSERPPPVHEMIPGV